VDPLPGRAGRLLVVDDERAVRFLVRTVLTRVGYEVFEADGPDEAEAFLAARAESVDLLITDVVMAGGSGPALFDRVAPTRPALRVLFMSGYAEVSAAAAPEHELRGPLLQKPFTVEELTRKVRQALEG
jgi:DNA-binding NtrC family response regulator